ncbi:ethanolamine utilization protein EutH [Clostridium sp.]|uniref:ethanolamine utilization protein EutH n=1 Tax=Clostridium sp. TaxID=1506 RepID=UPI002FC81697
MISNLVMYVIGSFFVLGAVDYILGNYFNLGNKFEEGIKTMGPLALGIIGIYSLTPMLLLLLTPVSNLVWTYLRIDPSIIPSTLLAMDMGGYELCKNIAMDSELGSFFGIVIGSSLGATVSFTLPVAFSMTQEQDKNYLSKGIMIGIMSIPVGIVAAGLWQRINIIALLWNMTPIIVFSIILGVGLAKAPDLAIKIFKGLGKLVIGLSGLGLLFQGIHLIYGFEFFGLLVPFEDNMTLVGRVSIILGGAYPMLEVINRGLKVPLNKLGKKVKLDSTAITSMIGNLASNLLVFGNVKDMNEKGKVMCIAFGVSGAFIFGGQLAFVASVEPKLMVAFFITKIVSGIVSLILSNYIMEKQNQQIIIREVMGYGD